MNVVIIDDGVNCGCFAGVDELEFDLEVNDSNRIMTRKEKSNTISHGTICAAIIKKYDKTVRLSSIKVISEYSRFGKVEHLLTALKWCEKSKIKIIHMSIGTSQFCDIEKIRSQIKRMLKNGVVIVAACSNRGETVAPACINGVVKVKSDNRLTYDEYEITNEFDIEGAVVKASSNHSLKLNSDATYDTPTGNSYAAPVLTSIISRSLAYYGSNNYAFLDNELNKMRFGEKTKTKNKYCRSNDIAIPIIKILGFSHQYINVAVAIASHMNMRGYPTMVLDRKLDNRKWLYAIPDCVDMGRYVNYISQKYNLSCIVIYEDCGIDADIKIALSKRKKYNGYANETIYLPYPFYKRNIKNAVDYIIKLGR